MRTEDFDYGLPPERIAQHPLAARDRARLLVDRGPSAPPEHRHVLDLPDLLEPGDLLVVNDTRVLPARLRLRKPTGGAAEVLLLERDDEGDGWWEALVRPGRRLAPGARLVDGDGRDVAEVGDELGDGRRRVRLLVPGDKPSTREAELALVDALGEMPLPPYITEVLDDPDRYQTVYARRPASAAAPTAGLHLTEDLLARVAERGVEVVAVELVVGLGTFRPIATDEVADHRMHGEAYRVADDVWAACRSGRRVVAVGTTVVRALESAAATGRLAGTTELFISRGFRFQVVDRLLTNFHLPRSSLLVLIDAFVGPRWRDLYDVALADDYRFLSFGDAMLVDRADLDDEVAA
ncbi:MAG: tRNA preQ1(34) S-adenosylmethionine ribosyltransferase-isomerase QueA [Acidimicrobiales bacterium]